MKLRKKARQYGLKKRHLALTSKENVFANYLQKLAVNMIFEAHKHRENGEVAGKFFGFGSPYLRQILFDSRGARIYNP